MELLLHPTTKYMWLQVAIFQCTTMTMQYESSFDGNRKFNSPRGIALGNPNQIIFANYNDGFCGCIQNSIPTYLLNFYHSSSFNI